MPATKELQRICFQARFEGGKADPTGIADVSIIKGNCEALGHGLFVDDRSVEQAHALLSESTLPAYMTHKGAGWADRLGTEIGIFRGFYRDGEKLKAKRFSYLKSFMKDDEKTYNRLVELAAEIPDQFGLSVVFEGDAVWPAEDEADEISADYPKPDSCDAQVPSIRFHRIESADFVKNPAANEDGLFGRPVDGKREGMADTIALSAHTTALAAKEAEVTAALSATHTKALDALKAEHLSALAAKETEFTAALAAKDKALADAGTAHAQVVAQKDAAIADHKKFDVRLSGVPEAVALAARLSAPAEVAVTLPEPAATDPGKWAQFTELQAKSPKAAAEFKAKYLSRK